LSREGGDTDRETDGKREKETQREKQTDSQAEKQKYRGPKNEKEIQRIISHYGTLDYQG